MQKEELPKVRKEFGRVGASGQTRALALTGILGRPSAGKWLRTKNSGENGERGSKNEEKGSLTKLPQISKYPPPQTPKSMSYMSLLCLSCLCFER